MTPFDLTPFEEITSAIPRPSMWGAAFAEVQALLLEANPAGVELLEIGRAAWDCLPDQAARDEAFDALFYGWWEADQDRQASAARDGSAGGVL